LGTIAQCRCEAEEKKGTQRCNGAKSQREAGKAGEKKGTQRCKGARTQREGRRDEGKEEEKKGEPGGGEE